MSYAGRVPVRIRFGQWWTRRTHFPREVYVLALIGFCVAVGFGVLVPVLPVFARSFGIGNLEAGAVISAFGFLRFLFSPFAARMLRRFSERVVLSAGVLIVAASSAAAGLATSYPQLLIMRGLGGIGSAMFSVSAMTLLLRSVTAEQRGRASGTMQSGFLLGGMAGPALGSLLARISLTAPFFFYAVTLAVAGLVGALLLRPPAHDPLSRATGSATVRSALADAGYRAACMANFSQGWNSFGVRSSLVPILVVESLHRSPADAGIAFAIAAVAQTLALAPAGRFVDTTGRRPALMLGGVLCGVSIAATPWATSLTWLTVAMVVYGLGASLLGTAPAAAVGDVVGPRGGQPVAVFSMMSDIGGILGPLVAGLLADVVSMQLAFAVGAGLAILATLMASVMAPGVPHRDGETPDPVAGPEPDPPRT
ncbi:MFS transporter [Naumannella halotolerans]|uniref:Putative MFS family arabinose efflux permease n=1 Tax=Naumannella halotolerans TaxID=993414 RepID=A0A4R7J5S0_9ACTN|nr:MFS transporter [Naumannella halotolerans]TDT32564.1 putative MFS family arabinose efflux permease [Naumannella halotolerans]